MQLPPSLPNNLSKPPKPLMLPQETPPIPTLPTPLKPLLDMQETFKPLVTFHTIHTQLENNGPVNQQTDLCKFNPNTSMDLTQFPFMRPTELTPTETTRPLKPRDQLSPKSNKDGNLRATPTTGPLMLWLANKDGQMKSTHGPSHLLSDKMICQKLTLLTPV